jgi:hypothetical protein
MELVNGTGVPVHLTYNYLGIFLAALEDFLPAFSLTSQPKALAL